MWRGSGPGGPGVQGVLGVLVLGAGTEAGRPADRRGGGGRLGRLGSGPCLAGLLQAPHQLLLPLLQYALLQVKREHLMLGVVERRRALPLLLRLRLCACVWTSVCECGGGMSVCV